MKKFVFSGNGAKFMIKGIFGPKWIARFYPITGMTEKRCTKTTSIWMGFMSIIF